MSKENTLVWENAFFIAFEWERCDKNGNGIFTAYFLLNGEVFHRFCVWGYSEERNLLERLKPLSVCTLHFRWCRGKKWLSKVEVPTA